MDTWSNLGQSISFSLKTGIRTWKCCVGSECAKSEGICRTALRGIFFHVYGKIEIQTAERDELRRWTKKNRDKKPQNLEIDRHREKVAILVPDNFPVPHSSLPWGLTRLPDFGFYELHLYYFKNIPLLAYPGLNGILLFATKWSLTKKEELQEY